MVVKTQRTSPVADKAQHGIMELLLINHPLDCPVCDKGGECPLQNQAMSNGRATSRFVDVKRTFPKPIAVSTTILLDRERCVLCQRCTRFSQEIAGDAFIDLQKRGAAQQIGRFDEAVLDFAPPRARRPATARWAWRWRTRPDSRSRRTSPATPCRSARSARSRVRRTASGRARSTWSRRRRSPSTTRPGRRSASTTAGASCCAVSPARTRSSTRSGSPTGTASPSRGSPRRTASRTRSCATARSRRTAR